MNRNLGLAWIDLYQRHLSPWKGFRCAYAAYHQAPSCSHYGREILASQGYEAFFRLMVRRLRECRQAHLAFLQHTDPNNPGPIRQKSTLDACDFLCIGEGIGEIGCCFLGLLG